MKHFFRRVSPRRAVTDLVDHWHQPTAHRWPILGVAMAITFAIFMVMIPPSQIVKPRPPQVIFISTFDEARTEAQIIATNCANEQLKRELQALLEEREEIRRDMYRVLGRATFIDVEAMEAKIAQKKAAEQAGAAGATADQPGLAEAGAEADDEAKAALSLEEYCAMASA